jgi:hypothetical protein
MRCPEGALGCSRPDKIIAARIRRRRRFLPDQAVSAFLDRRIRVWCCVEQHVGQRADTQDSDRNEYQKHACLSLIEPTTGDAVLSHEGMRWRGLSSRW